MVDSLFERRDLLGVDHPVGKGRFMFGRDKTFDKELLKTVNKRLSRGGGRVSAGVQQGTVTLSGDLQYEAQRRPLIKSIASIAGVRSVVDQLRLKPKITE